MKYWFSTLKLQDRNVVGNDKGYFSNLFGAVLFQVFFDTITFYLINEHSDL